MDNLSPPSTPTTGADILRRFYAALKDGDIAAAAACLSADVVLHVPGDNLARVDSGRIAEIWYHNFDQRHVDAFWGTR